MHHKIIVVLLLLCTVAANAKNVGTQGQTFAINETDFRTFIAQRLQMLQRRGEITRYETAAKKRITAEVYHPHALPLSTRSDTKVIRVDPTVVLNRPITNGAGRVLVAAGTRINPFKTIHYQPVLIFFNGDDKAQVKWVAAHYRDYKWVKFILTGGNLQTMGKRFGRIYFDQGEKIAQKLHVTSVPAVVQQSGLKWKVTMIGSNRL